MLMMFTCILTCVVAYDLVGVIILQFTYIKLDVVHKFIRPIVVQCGLL